MSKRNVWSYKKSKKKKPSKNSVEAIKTVGEYYVEEIIDHAYDKHGRLMYLLKWEGYEESDNSWEFDKQLLDCCDALDRFKTTFNGRHPPMFSWEEFDNFSDYLKRVVSPSFQDIAVVYKLSNKSVPIWDLKDEKRFSEMKSKIGKQIEELFEKTFDERHRNSERVKAMDLANKVSKTLKIKENFGSIRGFVEFVDKRSKIVFRLKEWSDKINEQIVKSGEGLPISVANDVDEEVPTLFRYICESIFDHDKFKKKTVAEQFAPHSCECEDCYDERQDCCSPVIGFPVVYNRKGLLSNQFMSHINNIFECNMNCKCGTDCPNRVVQRGRQFRIELFRTEDATRGWGVRALESMPKGAYVSSYVGEVVSLTEANQRPTTYLFDLSASWDTTDNEYTYVIDANKYGNILRYVNHSCEPNCRVIFVWSDAYDRLLPKVCLFTTKVIRPNEELTYDYGMQIINIDDQDYWEQCDTVSTDSGNASNETEDHQNKSQRSATSPRLVDEKLSKVSFKQIECRCGSDHCRKYLYS